MAGCCGQLQHCNIWHILGCHGHAHAHMNSTCSSFPCLCISIVRSESNVHNQCTIAWVGPADSKLYITGILYIGVAALRAVMSTALHASDWHRGKRCGFICVQARKSQVVQMAVQHNVCALLVADILLLLLFYTLHVYCVDPHRLGACVPSST
jgi:hypothetical protein